MLRLLTDHKERNLLIFIITLFALLCFIELRLPLDASLDGTAVGDFLVSDVVHKLSSGLLAGIMSAYLFYLLIDFRPRLRNERTSLSVLNSLLASILDAYDKSKIFGHETAINHVSKDVLKKGWFDQNRATLKECSSSFYQLKFAMETADSRLEDFKHSMPLAVSLSPEHAKQWLVIIDKVRLLSANYGHCPLIPDDKVTLVDEDCAENPVREYKATLAFRFNEFFQESENWLFPDAQKQDE